MSDNHPSRGKVVVTYESSNGIVKMSNDYTGETHIALCPQEKEDEVHVGLFSQVVTGIGLVSSSFYLTALFANISEAHKSGRGSLLSAQLFAVSQVLENFGPMTESVWRMCAAHLKSEPARSALHLVGDDIPSVDVVVVACGEPNDVVMDTVKAACKIDWPRWKLRIILADDGADVDLRKMSFALRQHHPNLYYHARYKPQGEHHGYKAGNLNKTLVFVDTLEGGQHDFICVLDADMIPEHNILRALMPHAIRDPNAGMVVVAQHFYNIPDNDPLYQSNVSGTGAADGIGDSVGAAWCPGSGFLMRNEAWKSIGGFPEFTVTEDLLTSWLLHGAGWRIVLLHETMQWGTQPDCILTHLKQRRRWWTGHVADAIRMKFTFGQRCLRQATTVQRVAMFHHCCRPFMGTVFKLFSWILIALALVIGGPVVATPHPDSLATVLFPLAIIRALAVLGDVMNLFQGGFWNSRRCIATNTWLALHFARDVLQHAAPAWLGGHRLGFEVSGVAAGRQRVVKERDVEKRPTLIRRIRMLNQGEGILKHAYFVGVMTCLFIGSVTKALGQTSLSDIVDNPDAVRRLVVGAGFPGLSIIETIPLFLTPLVYAIFPPTMPARRERMVLDKKTKLWRVKEECKTVKWTCSSFWLVIPHLIGTAWMVIVVNELFVKEKQGVGRM